MLHMTVDPFWGDLAPSFTYSNLEFGQIGWGMWAQPDMILESLPKWLNWVQVQRRGWMWERIHTITG